MQLLSVVAAQIFAAAPTVAAAAPTVAAVAAFAPTVAAVAPTVAASAPTVAARIAAFAVVPVLAADTLVLSFVAAAEVADYLDSKKLTWCRLQQMSTKTILSQKGQKKKKHNRTNNKPELSRY